jgi:hypothetical protein
MEPEWNSTLYVRGVEPGDRAGAAERVGLSWVDPTRIQNYRQGYDFTNTVNLDEEVDGDWVFDLTSCRFAQVDYVSGKHGCFHIALMCDDSYAFLIGMIEYAKGVALCNATRTIQREWRKKLALRRNANLRALCINLARMARYTYYMDPETQKKWWWVEATGEWGWCQ